jgi:hypothetical protein
MKKLKNEPCATPYFTMHIINCVTQLNFLRCPTLLNTKECNRTINFVKNVQSCGEKVNGTNFIHADFYAPPINDQESVGKREI